MNTITFSTRKRSVKSVFVGLRVNAVLTNQKCDSASAWKNNEITEYQYSVGGRRIPSAPIKITTAADGQDVGSCYNNTLMALGHYDSNLRGTSSTRSRDYLLCSTLILLILMLGVLDVLMLYSLTSMLFTM